MKANHSRIAALSADAGQSFTGIVCREHGSLANVPPTRRRTAAVHPHSTVGFLAVEYTGDLKIATLVAKEDAMVLGAEANEQRLDA